MHDGPASTSLHSGPASKSLHGGPGLHCLPDEIAEAHAAAQGGGGVGVPVARR
eukprot:m.41062 g.41062  ORF g.41062 m.41062 type:complete len:53 (-) comp5649_c0_seq1:1822-1980(-)